MPDQTRAQGSSTPQADIESAVNRILSGEPAPVRSEILERLLKRAQQAESGEEVAFGRHRDAYSKVVS